MFSFIYLISYSLDLRKALNLMCVKSVKKNNNFTILSNFNE